MSGELLSRATCYVYMQGPVSVDCLHSGIRLSRWNVEILQEGHATVAGVRIGLISDTHGLMRVEALAALAGVEVILHAGDVGGRSVLTELAALAPVHAVFGNVDDGSLQLPATLALSFGGVAIHVSHGH